MLINQSLPIHINKAAFPARSPCMESLVFATAPHSGLPASWHLRRRHAWPMCHECYTTKAWRCKSRGLRAGDGCTPDHSLRQLEGGRMESYRHACCISRVPKKQQHSMACNLAYHLLLLFACSFFLLAFSASAFLACFGLLWLL